MNVFSNAISVHPFFVRTFVRVAVWWSVLISIHLWLGVVISIHIIGGPWRARSEAWRGWRGGGGRRGRTGTSVGPGDGRNFKEAGGGHLGDKGIHTTILIGYCPFGAHHWAELACVVCVADEGRRKEKDMKLERS